MEEEIILIQLIRRLEARITTITTLDRHLVREAQIILQQEQIQQTHTTTLDQLEVTRQILILNLDLQEVTLILKQQLR